MPKQWLQQKNISVSEMTIESTFEVCGYVSRALHASISHLGYRVGLLVVVCAVMFAASVSARQGTPPKSRQAFTLPLHAVAVVELPGVNADALRTEDEGRAKPAPMRFAVPRKVRILPGSHGTWESLPDQGKLWRLQVYVPGALNLNFGFTTYRLPPGATLHITSAADDHYEGPYTAQDNKAHGQLWTPVVPGDRAVIELYLPPGAAAFELELTRIGAGYRNPFHKAPQSPEKQGRCNIDVVCPEGDLWRDQIRSVAVYTVAGVVSCTGQMIMDVPGTFRPFFLTAEHCDVTRQTAPSMVVGWNFESPTCGALGGGRMTDTQTGATFLASDAATDFALVELDRLPDPEFQVFYTGWDRTGAIPMGSVGIHHPQGGVKAISFNEDPLTIGDSCIFSGAASNTHWYVDNWEIGTTEPGSSGSGLWHPESQRLIGTLSGGLASCEQIDFDCYGIFAVAWDRGASASERLQDWLDPNNQGPLTVDGADPNQAPSLPLPIPDNDAAGVSHDQEMMRNIAISDIKVRVQIDHTRVGDLHVLLKSPNGTEVVLLDRPGVPATERGCDDDDLEVTFDDGADVDLELYCEAMTPWYQGAAKSLEPLEAFIGETSRGTWTLTVVDHADMEEGELIDWELMIEGMTVTPRLPLDIPDNDGAGVSHEREVMENAVISDIDVRVQIDHMRVGDLHILLRSPSGTEVVLLDRPGVPHTALGCQDDNMDVIFDDETKFALEQYCNGTTPWYEGRATPAASLNALTGETAGGVWTLIVSDRAAMSLGQLIDWELRITSFPTQAHHQ